MTDLDRSPRLVTVRLPHEIDLANAADVYAQIFGAITPETKIVVADLTSTGFCDSSGMHEILHARRYAKEAGVEFGIVVPPGGVLRAMRILGLDQIMQPYPALAAALDQQPGLPAPTDNTADQERRETASVPVEPGHPSP